MWEAQKNDFITSMAPSLKKMNTAFGHKAFFKLQFIKN